MKKYNVVIIGAGPTGLGCAYRLKELGKNDFKIFDVRNYVGGLAASFQDKQGFWWDIGGHVQFSHYLYFDELMNQLLPHEWLNHLRESWVWILNRFVPYPFQNNIHRLPKAVMLECLDGLIEIYKQPLKNPPKNFEEWILQTAGSGIGKYFMIPYNLKVWAHHPKQMNAVWVGERVAITDLGRVVKNIVTNTDDVSWGPNNTFRFPRQGGTGEIWRRLGKKIGSDYFNLKNQIVKIKTQKKKITLHTGEEIGYEYLVSTMPLDQLIYKTDLPQKYHVAAKNLHHSRTHIVGIGLEGQPQKDLQEKCWMYFPEDNCPFYRVTLFSKYSPQNVPNIKKQFSLMCEVAHSEFKPVNTKSVSAEVIKGLYNTKLITKKDKIVSVWKHTEEYGYPIPSLKRDEALRIIQPELMRRNILSRGRFGMWKYEVSNQDHSMMQGVEAANFIINETPELTAWYPTIVNGPKPY